jgi:hypothetical protein
MFNLGGLDYTPLSNQTQIVIDSSSRPMENIYSTGKIDIASPQN